MLSTFPSAWLVLGLPFASAAAIAHSRPLRNLSARRHRITWPAGALGLCLFSGGLVGLLPEDWTLPAILLGGAVSGFVCFWTTSTDDEDDDWRRWTAAPDEPPPPPGLPDIPRIDWAEFDRARTDWGDRPAVRP